MVVERSLLLAQSPESIWPHLSDAQRLSEWLELPCSLDGELGGRVSVGEAEGAVIRWGPPTQVAFTLPVDEDGVQGRSVVSLDLVEISTGTRITVLQTLVDPVGADALRDALETETGKRWDAALDRLQHQVSS